MWWRAGYSIFKHVKKLNIVLKPVYFWGKICFYVVCWSILQSINLGLFSFCPFYHTEDFLPYALNRSHHSTWINRNHATNLSAHGRRIAENRRMAQKVFFDFIEIVNNHWLKREIVHQVVRFIFHFSLKSRKGFWRYFHCKVLWLLYFF